ncbi:MAG: hypothetical protein KBS66_01510 [Eubacterium sp.]|nr:hypothetical protein [Candidatus Colimonas fimequi]
MAAIKRLSGKSLLIIELSILLVFFVAASAVCVNMFTKASEKAENANVLNEAVVETTTIAETLKACNGDLTKTGKHIAATSDYELGEGTLTIYYDDDMNPIAKGNSTYTATITQEKDGKLFIYAIDIKANDARKPVYHLDFQAIKRGGKVK